MAGGGGVADRVDAGRALASFVEPPSARTALVQLVLDTKDTLVTLRVATSLLRRHDELGLQILAAAVDSADDGHRDWIADAIHGVFSVWAEDRDVALTACARLTAGADPAVRRGAEWLGEVLAEAQPLLRSSPR